MPRPEHPLIVLAVENLARRFDIDPADLWAWLDRKRPAPRWFVEAAVAAFYPGLRESDFDVDEGLTSRNTNNTVNTVDATTNSLRSRAKLADQNRGHEAIKAWAAAGVTVAEVAEILTKDLKRKVPRTTVQAWYKEPKDPAYRRIPDDAAAVCERRWGIRRGAWHSIIPPV